MPAQRRKKPSSSNCPYNGSVPTKQKLYLLITPSGVSIFVGVVMSLIFTGAAAYLLAENSGRLGSFSINSYIVTIGLDQFFSSAWNMLDSLQINHVIFIAFWAIIGFICYTVLFLFKESFDESVGFWQRLHYVHASQDSTFSQLFARFIMLAVALFGWVLFSLVFAWYVLPGSLSLINDTIVEQKNAVYTVLSFLVMLLTNHVAVILLRFTLLRVRVTGGGTIE
jgi:hypothetical protein